MIATTNPPLFYPDMIKHGSSASLCGTLSHENVDITASVIELFEEMTDDDVLDAGEEGRTEEELENSQRKGEDCMNNFLDSLLEHSLVELLIQNLSRFNDDVALSEAQGKEGQDQSSLLVASDSGAVYHLLGLIENLVSLRSSLAIIFLSNTFFLDWLLNRMSRKGAFDQNKAFAGELLGILMQIASSQAESRNEGLRIFGQRSGVGKSLEVLAVSFWES